MTMHANVSISNVGQIPSLPYFFSLKALRGAFKIVFRKKFGIWPNQQTPPCPLPVVWAAKKRKKFNVYFAFQAILSILFFHEKCHFFGWDNQLGLQDPHELIRYGPPFMYCVFHHISGHLPRQIWFWKILTKT